MAARRHHVEVPFHALCCEFDPAHCAQHGCTAYTLCVPIYKLLVVVLTHGKAQWQAGGNSIWWLERRGLGTEWKRTLAGELCGANEVCSFNSVVPLPFANISACWVYVYAASGNGCTAYRVHIGWLQQSFGECRAVCQQRDR